MSKTHGELSPAISLGKWRKWVMDGIWSPIREDFVGHVRETGLYLVGGGEPSIVLRCAIEDRG